MRKLKITELNRLTVDEFKKADKLPLAVVLDEVRSLHNIGAVFRTSDAFLVDCIYLCGITATPPHPEMHKTALGAENSVEWRYKKNTLDAVQELHDQGFTVLAIEQVEGSTLLDKLELDADKKYAIVMGNEVKGVQQEVVNACDGCVEIPQYGTKHSLNVSVTTGIILWQSPSRSRNRNLGSRMCSHHADLLPPRSGTKKTSQARSQGRNTRIKTGPLQIEQIMI